MYNLATYTQTSTSTWQSNRYHSSIDYIWANQPLLRYLNSFTIDDPDTSTQSDYKILNSCWFFPYAYVGKPRYSTKTHRRTFLYKNMDRNK